MPELRGGVDYGQFGEEQEEGLRHQGITWWLGKTSSGGYRKPPYVMDRFRMAVETPHGILIAGENLLTVVNKQTKEIVWEFGEFGVDAQSAGDTEHVGSPVMSVDYNEATDRILAGDTWGGRVVEIDYKTKKWSGY